MEGDTEGGRVGERERREGFVTPMIPESSFLNSSLFHFATLVAFTLTGLL